MTMRTRIWGAALLVLVGCSDNAASTDTSVKPTDMLPQSNPFQSASTLPYQTPDFAAIEHHHFAPAFDAGMAEHRREIEAIIGQQEAPSFANTVVALEQSGELLRRARRVFNHLVAVANNPERKALKASYARRFSEHNDSIYQDPTLFGRIDALYQQRDQLELAPEDRRLLEQTHQRFVRTGAALSEQSRARVQQLNVTIAQLTNRFGENLQGATDAAGVWVDEIADLAGLSDSQIRSAQRAAERAGSPERFLLTLKSTTRQPALANLKNRALRERLWRASAERGVDGEFENQSVIPALMLARAEKAQLLGYDHWAGYRLDKQMAGEPEQALALLGSMAADVVANSGREAEQLRAQMTRDGAEHELAPWDWLYYAERVRQTQYELDSKQVSEYLEFHRVLEDGVFYTMKRLFGIRFEPRSDLPVYHPDVLVYEVFDEQGQGLGLFYGDFFARPGKRGGAWMANFVHQSNLQGSRPVVLNVANIARAPEGQPQLLTPKEVNTLFHEMGHGVHGLLSDVTYRSLSGTAVPRDFAEFPAKFQEDWRFHPEVIANYAFHHQTGEPIPPQLLAKAMAAERFNKGFDTQEYLAAALLDLEWHSLAADAEIPSVAEFDAAALARHGLSSEVIPPRYGSTFFGHVFARGYSASYYAYLWSEIMAADAYAHLQRQGGLSRESGERFRKEVLAKGNSEDLMSIYTAFRGQPPSPEALLARRGLSVGL
ncbi:M3 family metallopeptidase [Ferrimonas marina]